MIFSINPKITKLKQSSRRHTPALNFRLPSILSLDAQVKKKIVSTILHLHLSTIAVNKGRREKSIETRLKK